MPKKKTPGRSARPKSGSGGGKKRASGARHKSTTVAFGEASFDDEKRKEWVTGYHKRKVGRRKQAAHDASERARKERIEARKERREAERAALGLLDDDGVDAGGAEGDGGDGGDAAATAYDSGVVVTVAAGLGDDFE